MNTSEPKPLTDDELAAARDLVETADLPDGSLHTAVEMLEDFIIEVDRLRAALAEAPSRRDLLVAEEIARSCELAQHKAEVEASRLRAENTAMASRLNQLEHGIQGTCPSCHHNSLTIDEKGWLVCHWSTCQAPDAAALAVQEAADRALGGDQDGGDQR